MTALHLSAHPWAGTPRMLLATFAVVTVLLVVAVVTLALLLSASRAPADVGGTTAPPAKTCPGGPPNADC